MARLVTVTVAGATVLPLRPEAAAGPARQGTPTVTPQLTRPGRARAPGPSGRGPATAAASHRFAGAMITGMTRMVVRHASAVGSESSELSQLSRQ